MHLPNDSKSTLRLLREFEFMQFFSLTCFLFDEDIFPCFLNDLALSSTYHEKHVRLVNTYLLAMPNFVKCVIFNKNLCVKKR